MCSGAGHRQIWFRRSIQMCKPSPNPFPLCTCVRARACMFVV
jgi:hypothetical protein